MKKIIFIILGLILLLIFFLIKNDTPTEYNSVELDDSNLIANRTFISYYDTIASIGLSELNIEGVTLIFRSLEGNNEIDNHHLLAYIIGEQNQYVIYISELNKFEAIDIISHELIHLEQIRNERLIKRNGYSIWDGTEYSNDIEYSRRPWEVDAFNRGRDLDNKIKEILVK